MGQLIRLCYASHATLDLNQIGVELDRLLRQARTYNGQFDITGVLYYGKGFFFQCLEGDSDSIDKLYKKIRHDKRHEQVVLLDREPIRARLFGEPMKVVVINDAIRAMYNSAEAHPFIPAQLRRRDVAAFLALLERQNDYGSIVEFQHNSSMTTVVSGRLPHPLRRPLVLVLLGLIVAVMAFLLMPFFFSAL